MGRKYNRKQKTFIATLSIVALIVAIRLALPYVILHYANKSLDEMEGYRGQIEDTDILPLFEFSGKSPLLRVELYFTTSHDQRQAVAGDFMVKKVYP